VSIYYTATAAASIYIMASATTDSGQNWLDGMRYIEWQHDIFRKEAYEGVVVPLEDELKRLCNDEDLCAIFYASITSAGSVVDCYQQVSHLHFQ